MGRRQALQPRTKRAIQGLTRLGVWRPGLWYCAVGSAFRMLSTVLPLLLHYSFPKRLLRSLPLPRTPEEPPSIHSSFPTSLILLFSPTLGTSNSPHLNLKSNSPFAPKGIFLNRNLKRNLERNYSLPTRQKCPQAVAVFCLPVYPVSDVSWDLPANLAELRALGW